MNSEFELEQDKSETVIFRLSLVIECKCHNIRWIRPLLQWYYHHIYTELLAILLATASIAQYHCANSPCDGNATCVTTSGSFMCSCKENFTGDGFKMNRRRVNIGLISLVIDFFLPSLQGTLNQSRPVNWGGLSEKLFTNSCLFLLQISTNVC